ncbi:PGA52 family protein [Acetobacter pasteurianus]|nr:PGA52 family protein [Acetobacter pasteurianus]
MHSTILSALLVSSLVAAKGAVELLQFENFGYSGAYTPVAKLSDIYSDSCSCELSSTEVTFSGANTPLNEEVSVHFRGPLILSKFASYVSADYVYGDDSSGNWTRLSYYDADSGTSDNVTFLTKAGKNSSCLGVGLTYADSNGTGAADSSTVLAKDTLINSNDEYVIFSNISCGDSGSDGDCGVYRSDIPAYHGFYGTTKMFLFEFQMPNETHTSSEISNYNMPAIWLLNAQIPRTSQYSNNVNCSCWRSGCGEFDIFEVMNTTEYLNLYSTVHDYQGTDDIESGLAISSYIQRDLTGTMIGGVSFDSKGDATVWVSNSTSFDETLDAAKVNSWAKEADAEATTTLTSASLDINTATSSSSSKKGDGAEYRPSYLMNLVAMALSMLFL